MGRLSFAFLFWVLISNTASLPAFQITGINTINLRDRVIVLDKMVLKKTLIIAFDLSEPLSRERNLKVKGALISTKDTLGTGYNYFVEGRGGNVSLDVPFDLSTGNYTVLLEIRDSLNTILSTYSKVYDRWALKSYYYGDSSPIVRNPVEVPFAEKNPQPEPLANEQQQGYILYQRHYLRWVYNNSIPLANERIEKLEVSLAGNEYEPLTFSLYALRDLNMLTVSLTGDLQGPSGSVLGLENVAINTVESIPTLLGSGDNYRLMPRVIRNLDRISIPRRGSRRFWLTVHAGENQQSGEYRGKLKISAGGTAQEVELLIHIRPFALPDSIGADFCMLETYEFYELLENWTAPEREKIIESGRKIYEDYTRHGVYRLWPHSSYYFRRNQDGTPRLDELFTALAEAKKAGLTRPLVWFCGGLVQTAKPKHPGNVRLYDSVLMKERMRELVRYVKRMVALNGWPEVIFEPSDEPADNADYPLDRGEQARELLQVVKDEGGRTAETGSIGVLDGLVDLPVLGDPAGTDFLDIKARRPDLPVWTYNNGTITQNWNPAYTRYMWGFYVWRMNLNGMSAWTFQNAMNASGDPFTDLDGHGGDVMVALPDPQCPIPTPFWEAVREGIDDYRYIYFLTKLIEKADNRTLADSIARELEALKRSSFNPPTAEENRYGDWDPEKTDERRNLIAGWISAIYSEELKAEGDYNGDWRIDIQDVIKMILLLCESSGNKSLDLNKDGRVGIEDAIYLLIKVLSPKAG